MLPIMLISMPAGAIADMYDRRIVALASLSIALSGATALSVMAWLGLVTPEILLAFCFVVGCGHGAVRTGLAILRQRAGAGPKHCRPPVALNGISYNIAREFRSRHRRHRGRQPPARVAAFATNAVLYIPLLIVLVLWRRSSEPSRLPRERLKPRHGVGAVRYIANSPSIRIVLGPHAGDRP